MKAKRWKEPEPERETPSDDFCVWWYPTGVDTPSGASVGGHPDAGRIWARKDPGCWVRRSFGISADKAWLAQKYRDDYNAWVEAGRPERDYVSISLSIPEQAARWRAILDQLRTIPTAPSRAELIRSERARERVIQRQKVELLGDKSETDKDEKEPF